MTIISFYIEYMELAGTYLIGFSRHSHISLHFLSFHNLLILAIRIIQPTFLISEILTNSRIQLLELNENCQLQVTCIVL